MHADLLHDPTKIRVHSHTLFFSTRRHGQRTNIRRRSSSRRNPKPSRRSAPARQSRQFRTGRTGARRTGSVHRLNAFPGFTGGSRPVLPRRFRNSGRERAILALLQQSVPWTRLSVNGLAAIAGADGAHTNRFWTAGTNQVCTQKDWTKSVLIKRSPGNQSDTSSSG